jgi:hypothetical protein
MAARWKLDRRRVYLCAGGLRKDSEGRTICIVDAHRDDGRRFIVRAQEILTAFVELEREVLTVTFYLASIHHQDC